MSCNKLVVENDHDVMPLWQPPSAPQPYRPALPHDERAKSRALADHFQKRLGIPLAQGRAKWVAAFWTREEISTAIDSTAKANSPCWAYFARCLESANEKKPAATGGSNWNRTSAYEDDDDWVSAMRSRQKTKPMTLPASVQAQGWQ